MGAGARGHGRLFPGDRGSREQRAVGNVHAILVRLRVASPSSQRTRSINGEGPRRARGFWPLAGPARLSPKVPPLGETQRAKPLAAGVTMGEEGVGSNFKPDSEDPTRIPRRARRRPGSRMQGRSAALTFNHSDGLIHSGLGPALC